MHIEFVCPKCGQVARWGSTEQGGPNRNEAWCYCHGTNCTFSCPRSEFWKYYRTLDSAFESEDAFKAWEERRRAQISIDTTNSHIIGAIGNRVNVGRAIVGLLTKQEALVIAAYLVALSEPLPGDVSFEKVQLAVENT